VDERSVSIIPNDYLATLLQACFDESSDVLALGFIGYGPYESVSSKMTLGALPPSSRATHIRKKNTNISHYFRRLTQLEE
jgi:hypothetical protein